MLIGVHIRDDGTFGGRIFKKEDRFQNLVDMNNLGYIPVPDSITTSRAVELLEEDLLLGLIH